MKPRVSFQTLGCKLNSSESEALAAKFQSAGYHIVEFGEPAEVQIINTCTVTNKADRKSRNTVNKALHIAADEPFVPSAALPEPLVVVTGCFATGAKADLERDGRTFVVENERKAHIFDLVEARLRGEIVPLETLPPAQFTFPGQDQIFHTRGMLKIQDGCDNFCSFCIIPFVRGRAVSRPAGDILAEARQMVGGAGAYREIVLTGVNMSRYASGQDDFTRVVSAILASPADNTFRVRISSIEPEGFTAEFFGLFEEAKAITAAGASAAADTMPGGANRRGAVRRGALAPHLHLCLQSASERILLAMRRQYTYLEFREIAARLRSIDPLFNITTDIIVGFPGESEEEFQATLKAVEEIGFGHVHVFPFSIRSGTRAQRMDGKVPAAVIRERSRLLTAVAEESKRRYRAKLVGTVQTVLVEKSARVRGGIECSGFGEHYVPVRFLLPGEETDGAWNSFRRVRITGLAGGSDPVLVGEYVGDGDPGYC